jgi:HEAT repeat protein
MRAALVAVVSVLLIASSVSTQTPRPAGKGKGSSKKDKAPGTQAAAGNTFAGKTLQQWKAELKHADASKRSLALIAIAQPVFVNDSAAAVPAIIDRLRDRDMSVRIKACLALRSVTVDKDDISKVVKGLAALLLFKNEREAYVRYEAASSLRRFADQAAEAIPDLINGLSLDRISWENRHMCAATLWRAALNTKEGTDDRAVKALVSAFHQGTYQERLEIVIGLGSLKKSRDPKVQTMLIHQLRLATETRVLENKPLCIWAFAGLVSHGDENTVKNSLSSIARFLKHENVEIRSQAVQALAALGKKAKSQVPAIITMLDDKEIVAVDSACMALVRMGDTSDQVINPLLSLTQHQDPNRVGAAVVALVNLKASGSPVLSTLEKVLEKEKRKPTNEANLGLIRLLEAAIDELKNPKKSK